MNSLILQATIRRGTANKQQRQYLDYIISGKSLLHILNRNTCDLITPFGWGADKAYEHQLLKEITMRNKPSLESGRVMLYVCPECGDIDCGAITAEVKDLGAKIVWRSFGYESGSGVSEEYSEIELMEFNRAEYFKAFSSIY